MPMYNLLEYSKYYGKTTGSLWNYCRVEPIILFLLILNLLNTRQVLQEILIILVLRTDFKLVKKCVLADMTAAKNPPTGLEFQITDTKLYVPVVTLSKKKRQKAKLLEQLISGFKRTVMWNKYRSQMISQPQNNNLNYLIDPTFTKVSRLFVLSFIRTATGVSE